MSSVFWRRIADYSQRSVSITLAGLTVLGLVILGQEGQGVVHRYKQGKALKKSMANTASQDNQVSDETPYRSTTLHNWHYDCFLFLITQALDNSSESSKNS